MRADGSGGWHTLGKRYRQGGNSAPPFLFSPVVKGQYYNWRENTMKGKAGTAKDADLES